MNEAYNGFGEDKTIAPIDLSDPWLIWGATREEGIANYLRVRRYGGNKEVAREVISTRPIDDFPLPEEQLSTDGE